MQELIKTSAAVIGGEEIQAVNARELWQFLEVGKDFSNWIKGRIEKYNFVEGRDYLLANSGEQLPSGMKHRIDYIITMDMAKELAMVENNDKGRQARQYFIEVEKRYRKGTPNADLIRQVVTQTVAAQAQMIQQVMTENFRLKLENQILQAFAPACGIENLGKNGKHKIRRGAEVCNSGKGRPITALLNIKIQLELPMI